MTDFKAKMHQILPQTPLGELTALPQTLWLDCGAASRHGEGLGWGREWKGEGKGREGKWRGGKGRAPKLLLNQGPSEPWYAIVTDLHTVHHIQR